MLYIGKTVLWYPVGDKSSRPCPAIVLSVGDTSLNLAIIQEGIRNISFRDGVHWVGDPNVNESDKIENGLWDRTAKDQPSTTVPPKKEAAK